MDPSAWSEFHKYLEHPPSCIKQLLFQLKWPCQYECNKQPFTSLKEWAAHHESCENKPVTCELCKCTAIPLRALQDHQNSKTCIETQLRNVVQKNKDDMDQMQQENTQLKSLVQQLSRQLKELKAYVDEFQQASQPKLDQGPSRKKTKQRGE